MFNDCGLEKGHLLLPYAGVLESTASPHIPLRKEASAQKRPPRRLAYIDGIRGVAAVLVYMLHYQNCTHSFAERAIMEHGWGFGGQYYFAALPFVRVLTVGGHHGVTTFFVISGYVLSHAPLRCIQAHDMARLHKNLSSALLRRFLRLWIPVVVTTFVYMLSWHLLGIKTVQETEQSLSAELVKWYDNIRASSFHYTTMYFNSYNFHVWTIPLEFRGSITVYTTLIALQNVPTNKRLSCELVLIWYFTYVTDGWFCALFMSGMLLCDLDLLADRGELPLVFGYCRRVQTWIFPILMIFSVYLGGVPCKRLDVNYLRANLGWYWLSYTQPRAMADYRWWFRGWAAILTIVAVPRIRVVRAFFESRFCQYLGKVSYAFYLLHGPVLYTLGDRLLAATGRVAEHHAELMPQWINWLPLPAWGPVGMELNHIAPHLILFPFTLWLADLTTRLVDDPTIEFCRWLDRWLSEEPHSDTGVSMG